MEKSHKDILARLRKNIIDDLDVDNDVVQPLRLEYILREDDLKRIYAGATREERAANLLDILPRCGPDAFEKFHSSLKHHYEWLSDEIDKLLGNYEIETNGEIDYVGPPNIPPHSPLTVTREEKVKQLKIALQQLNPTEYIVLHGMKGFGKSCLAASTLKDVKLVKDLFSNQVYWITFACDRLIDEEILIQLNTLYHNVRNLEIQPETFTPLAKDSLIQYLKHYFSKQRNCNALLILDDVYDKKIINTFDFKCKTLVLTADIDVLYEKRPTIIEMNDGFTETETLGLFAKVLEMDVNELPLEAKRIHEECKGMPLLIAMFAAQFEEFKYDMRIQPDRWRYYLESLRKKDARNKVMREFLEKQKTIFDICIEQLKPDLRKRYESLVIFREDVNITPKTLEIFWERDIFEVQELMVDLCHKSLAVTKWNKVLKSYIYGVHDLLLCHLRKKRTEHELKLMHELIIRRYCKYCNKDFSKLPNDNYIYSYIGYHLEQAKLFKEFPQLYLNFDFIQAKIMHAGLNDLLLDLKMYRKYITIDYKDEEKIFDLERFLQEQASIIVEHRRKKCLDIIQIAMNYSQQGYVTQTAKNLAMTRREYLYLSHNKSLHNSNMPLTEEISMGICTSAFTDDPELILTGNTSGEIILWDSSSKKQQKIFNGHREEYSIKKIIVSTDGDCFLSLSSAGIIMLFPLDEQEENDQRHSTESPRRKQSCYTPFFINSKGQDDSIAKFWVDNEIILDMAFGDKDQYIVACTNAATIQVWDRLGKIVFILKDSKYEYLTKIAFTTHLSCFILHIMDESKGAFALYANSKKDRSTYQYHACYNLQLKSATEKVIFFHHIPKHDDSLMVITEKEAMYVRWWWNGDCVSNFSKQTRAFVDDDAVTYVCATITYDGDYIIMADSAGFINVWNTYSGYQPVATYKSRVISLDSYWLRDEGYHIICGNGDRILYRWKFPVEESDELPRKCLFDAIVEPYGKKDIVVKESPSKKIIVSHGENIINESELIEGKILSLQLSADGNEAVCITDKEIQLLNTKTAATELISKLDKPIEFVKIVNHYKHNMVVCRWKDNNLKVWQHSKPIFGVDTKANYIHEINNNHVITITQNGIIAIWYIDERWELRSQVNLSNPLSHILFSSLSYKQNYLAVLNESYDLILLHIIHKNAMSSTIRIQISNEPYFTYTFAQKATLCDISKNEQYIAVGLESGQISIIDIRKQMEITRLYFHTNPITQLHWAPTTIDVPILFSLSCDELVWWNVALVKNYKRGSQKRRSRMGISHSTSTPSLSTNALLNLQISNSPSVDAGVSNLQNDEASILDRYWRNKIGKDPKMPELLHVVELPPSRDPKICISSDFTKYVMVDMYGSINTFKLIDYDQP
ncbi:hypothetical protein P5V15_002125 [Pogonomyrmex californicus]